MVYILAEIFIQCIVPGGRQACPQTAFIVATQDPKAVYTFDGPLGIAPFLLAHGLGKANQAKIYEGVNVRITEKGGSAIGVDGVAFGVQLAAMVNECNKQASVLLARTTSFEA